MKIGCFFVGRRAAWSLAVWALPVGALMAETYVWTGAEDAYWTNAANWTVGGAVATRAPGVRVSGAGTDAEKADYVSMRSDNSIARFEGAFTRTTVDLDGLFSVSNVFVTGAATPAVTFGAAAGQRLPIAEYGVLEIDASAPRAPRLPHGLYMGKGVHTTGIEAIKFRLVQNCAEALHVETWYGTTWDPNYENSWSLAVPSFEGAGEIWLDGDSGFPSIQDVYFKNSNRIVVSGYWKSPRSFYVQTDFTLDIRPGGHIRFSRVAGAKIVLNSGLSVLVTGGGLMEFCTSVEETGAYSMQWCLAGDAKLTFDGVRVESILSSYDNNRGLTVGHTFDSANTGDLTFLATNAIAGPVWIYQPTKVLTPAIGAAGDDTPIGNGPEIVFANEGTLGYVGAGETTTRPLAITNRNNNARGVLLQAGSGEWIVASPVTARNGDATLVLSNRTDAAATLATALADTVEADGVRALSLEKSGPGRWTLTGACTHTGATTVKDGTLALAETASLAHSTVTLAGGAFEVVGGTDAPRAATLAVSSAGGILRVTGRADVTLASYTRTGGTLDVVPDDGARVVFPAEADLTGVTYKGMPAGVGEDRALKPLADALIAATGDVVPNAGAGAGVAIVSSGTGGNDALAEAETEVRELRQMSGTPCTVEIGEGRTFKAARVAVSRSSAALTIGAPDDAGAFAPTAERPFACDDAAAALALNALLAPVDGRTTVGAEAGRVTFAGGSAPGTELKVTAAEVTLTGARPFDFNAVNLATNAGVAKVGARLVLDGARVVMGPSRFAVGACLKGEMSDTGSDSGTEGHDTAALTPRLVVTNSVISLRDPATCRFDATCTNAICVGHQSRGILEVRAGAVLTNKIMVGCCFHMTSSSAAGSVWQTGGAVELVAGSDLHKSSCVGGRNGRGYWVLEDGTLTGHGNFGVGNYTVGLLHQKGGTFTMTNAYSTATAGKGELLVGRANGGRGVFYATGGRADLGNVTLGFASGENTGHLIVADDADVSCGKIEGGSNKGNYGNVAAWVTLAGGSLTVDYFHSSTQNFYKAAGARNVSNYFAVNFNGGTLRKSAVTPGVDVFNPHTWSDWVYPDHVTVYAGGATIDTAGVDCSAGIPIEGAAGLGVVAVPLTGAAITGLPTAPEVKITGDGRDAVAVAEFDRETGTVTGIRVLSPGHGYTTASCRVDWADNARALSCVLGENLGGNFTKKGDGAFTLKAANSWKGATVLQGGTLKLDAPDALPEGTTVKYAGGALASTAAAWNDRAELAVELPAAALAARTRVDLVQFTDAAPAHLPVLTVVNAPAADAPLWRARLSGKTLRATFAKGTLLLFR